MGLCATSVTEILSGLTSYKGVKSSVEFAVWMQPRRKIMLTGKRVIVIPCQIRAIANIPVIKNSTTNRTNRIRSEK